MTYPEIRYRQILLRDENFAGIASLLGLGTKFPTTMYRAPKRVEVHSILEPGRSIYCF